MSSRMILPPSLTVEGGSDALADQTLAGRSMFVRMKMKAHSAATIQYASTDVFFLALARKTWRRDKIG